MNRPEERAELSYQPTEAAESQGPAPSQRASRLLLVAVVVLLLGSSLAAIGSSTGHFAIRPVGPAGAPTPGIGVAALAPTNPGISVSDPVLPTTSIAPSYANFERVGGSEIPTISLANSLSDFSVAKLSQAMAPGLRSPSAAPAGASTASNWYVDNYAQTGNTIQVGPSNRSLASTGFYAQDLANVSVGSTFYQTHGFVGVAVTKNGGASWVTNYPAQATAWSTSGNINYGDVLGTPVLDPLYTSGLSPITLAEIYGFNPLNPSIGATPSGGDMFLVSPFAPSCDEYFASPCGAAAYNASAGIAASVSTNGGTTWANPVPIWGAPRQALNPAVTSSACGNIAAETYALPWIQMSSLDGAVSTYGDAFAAWTVTTYDYSTPNLLVCNATLGAYVLALSAVHFDVYTSESTNSGATWAAPSLLFDFDWNSSYLGPSLQVPYTPIYGDVHLAIGAPPKEATNLVFTDLINGTAFGNEPLAISSTSNNGTAWSKPTDGSFLVNVVRASSPGWFYNGSIPILAVDNWSTSSHEGNMYLVWGDNRTSTQASGYPSIAFSKDTGAGWSTPVYVSPNTPAQLVYFEPTVSVGPNGNVWIAYYGVNPSNGNYHVYGVFSTDGGASWSSQFVISDSASTPGSGANAIAIFGTPSIAPTSAGAYVSWQDCRAVDCDNVQSPTDENMTEFVALVHSMTVTSTATGINATITVGGVPQVDAIPATLGVDTNVSMTVSVPSFTPTPNGTYIEEFASYSGATSSTTNPVTFTYTGGNLVVHYVLAPAAWIDGTVTPHPAGLSVSVVDLSNGQRVSPKLLSGLLTFNATVPAGANYNITATAPNYQPAYALVTTSSFTQSDVHMTLPKVTGTISGTVQVTTGPSGLSAISVSVNGTKLWTNGSNPNFNFNQATGHFTAVEPWGYYWVNATPTTAGQYSNTSSNITLAPGGTFAISPSLEGVWINGSVSPYPVTVTINGAPVTLDVTGGSATWNEALPGGTYTVRAFESGYSSFSSTYTLKPGQAHDYTGPQAISLTDFGTIQGVITPPNNGANVFPVLYVNGVTHSVYSSGAYNVSLVQSSTPYNVTVKLLGYNTTSEMVLVTPGNTSWENITLIKTPPKGNTGCAATNTCPSNTTTTTPATGLTTLDYVGIGLIVVLVVVAAIALLMRRGSGGAPMSGSSSPPEASTPSEEPMMSNPPSQDEPTSGSPPS